MPGANGEYVKIYLYLLRCLKPEPQELSISLIADKFDHTESDVCRALKYWEKMKLLKLDYDGSRNLTGVHILEGVSSGTAAEAPEEPEAPEALSASRRLYSPKARLLRNAFLRIFFLPRRRSSCCLSVNNILEKP